MRSAVFTLVLLFVVVLSVVYAAKVAVDDPRVVREAEFAVSELSKLSDSRIYTTLSLAKVLSAESNDGIFHDNMILSLELASPHFKSGKSKETFEMVVMTHKEDGVRTLAIDEFPVMDDDAIEEFWIKKVEDKRRQRTEAFRKLALESIYTSDEFQESGEINVSDELSILDKDPKVSEFRNSQLQSILKRIPEPYKSEEQQLGTLTLVQLLAMTTDNKSSDFKVYRAQQIIDSVLKEFSTKSNSQKHQRTDDLKSEL